MICSFAISLRLLKMKKQKESEAVVITVEQRRKMAQLEKQRHMRERFRATVVNEMITAAKRGNLDMVAWH